ncbi:hypothetical protein BH24ACT15_BH24ACT15_32290 [soil metagenome]
MQSFLVQSLIASVVLTILLNVIPRLFPKASAKAERRVIDGMNGALQQQEGRDGQPRRSRVKVFFPWKAMLVGSIILTVLVNLIGLVVR